MYYDDYENSNDISQLLENKEFLREVKNYLNSSGDYIASSFTDILDIAEKMYTI